MAETSFVQAVQIVQAVQVVQTVTDVQTISPPSILHATWGRKQVGAWTERSGWTFWTI